MNECSAEFINGGHYIQRMPRSSAPACCCTQCPPWGDLQLHEIKHDGFRVIARRSFEIEDDLLGRRLVRVQEQGDEQAFDRCPLLILCRLCSAQLQPVQRRLAVNRRAVLASCFELARHTAITGSWCSSS
jgi:hypothetical protein